MIALPAILYSLALACVSEAPAPSPTAPTQAPAVDPDAQALANLDIPGPGQARRYRVTHLLRFSTPEAADSATVALSVLDLRVLAEPGEAGEAWEVAAWEDTALDLAHVRAHRAALEQLAASYGGHYDGWEATPLAVAPVVPQAQEPALEPTARP